MADGRNAAFTPQYRHGVLVNVEDIITEIIKLGKVPPQLHEQCRIEHRKIAIEELRRRLDQMRRNEDMFVAWRLGRL